MYGLAILFAVNNYTIFAFKKYAIAFPASLGAMVGIFASLLFFSIINSDISDHILQVFLPSMAFLKTWLALFFVPPLVVFPLKLHLLKGKVAKLLSVIIIGNVFSITSSAVVAQLTKRKESGSGSSSSDGSVSTSSKLVAPVINLPSPKPSLIASVLLLIAAFLNTSNGSLLYKIQYIFGFQTTVGGYLAASKWVSPKIKKVAHPAIFCAVLSMMAQYLFASVTAQPFESTLSAFYGGGKGIGDFISSFLGPAIITFGLQLYQYRELLRANSARMIITTLFSAFFGLFSSATMARIVFLGSPEIALSPLTRCITTPLALVSAKLTGADPSLSALAVVISGLLGASLGNLFLNAIGYTDDVTVGLAIGASSHGLGSASVTSEPVKFASSIVSMTLTGLFTVVLLSVPAIRLLLSAIAVN